jgi:hypothetical protein
MPNHTDNILTAPDYQGSMSKLLLPYLYEIDDDYSIDFEKVIPTPASVDMETPFGENGWYDWRVKNWGSKWNSYSPSLQGESLFFQTAWSPPLPIITKLSEILKTRLVLDYLDEGCGFIGRFTADYENGDDDECYGDVAEAPLWMRDIHNLPEEDLTLEEA